MVPWLGDGIEAVTVDIINHVGCNDELYIVQALHFYDARQVFSDMSIVSVLVMRPPWPAPVLEAPPTYGRMVKSKPFSLYCPHVRAKGLLYRWEFSESCDLGAELHIASSIIGNLSQDPAAKRLLSRGSTDTGKTLQYFQTRSATPLFRIISQLKQVELKPWRPPSMGCAIKFVYFRQVDLGSDTVILWNPEPGKEWTCLELKEWTTLNTSTRNAKHQLDAYFSSDKQQCSGTYSSIPSAGGNHY